MGEAQLHEHCSFITLTYNDETLAQRRPAWEPMVPYTPPSEQSNRGVARKHARTETRTHEDSLIPRDTQLFMKRLRKQVAKRNPSTRIKVYLVGEYGEKYKRPHYHLALFGESFAEDRYEWRTNDNGDKCYRSPTLEKLWTLGNSEIGELTIESAAYVASYVMKKVNGKMAEEHYRRETPSGDAYWLEPEFARMSRAEGIGKRWVETYHRDVYPHDAVLHKGLKMKPPRYYDKLMEVINPVDIAVARMMREHRAKQLADDNTPARLEDKEIVAKAKYNLKRHSLER